MITEIIPNHFGSFPQQDRDLLLDAASTWRMPYWDWAARKSDGTNTTPNFTLPLALQHRQVTIHTPVGQRIVNNPLFQFTMPSSTVPDIPLTMSAGGVTFRVREPRNPELPAQRFWRVRQAVI